MHNLDFLAAAQRLVWRIMIGKKGLILSREYAARLIEAQLGEAPLEYGSGIIYAANFLRSNYEPKLMR